eukprot:g16204.t1
MPSGNQTTRLRARLKAAEEEAAKKATEQAAEIAALKQQLAATSRSRASTATTTPPGRGTPGTRQPAQRPSSTASHTIRETGHDEAGGTEGDDGADDDSSSDNEERPEDEANGDRPAVASGETSDGDSREMEDRDLLITRQLVERFIEQQLSPEDRTAVMGSAGRELVDLLRQHWKEKSSPPEWLVSLFQPPPGRATDKEVDQVN